MNVHIDEPIWTAISQSIQRLENRWVESPPESLEVFLPAPGHPFRRRVLLELIKVDQEYHWKSGARKLTEAYLNQWPELGRDPEVVQEVLDAECLTRAMLGDMPDATELLARFPDVAPHINLEDIRRRSASENRPRAGGGDLPSSESSPTERRSVDSPPVPPLRIGQQFGRYQITTLLGQGGMGWVYRAHDTLLSRDVALKVPHFSPAADPVLAARFLSESRAAAQVDHRHVCTVHDAGEIDGVCYLTMRLVRGQSLAQRLGSGPLDPLAAADLTRKVATALVAIHSRGILHRDVKSSNILLDETGEPLLADFGLAKLNDAPKQDAEQGPGSASKEAQAAIDTDVESNTAWQVGHTAVQVGTLPYMSPELFQDREADVRSDIYSLGVVLYRMLTGRLPFVGQPHEIAAAVQARAPIAPRQLVSGIPRELESICLRALEKNPGDRFQTAAEMADALAGELDDGLHAATQPSAPLRRRTRLLLLVGTAFAALIILASVIIRVWRDGKSETTLVPDGRPLTVVEIYDGSKTGPTSRMTIEKDAVTMESSPPTPAPVSSPRLLDVVQEIAVDTQVGAITLSGDGRTLYVAYTARTAKQASRFEAFDVETGKLVGTAKTLDGSYDLHAVAVSADQRFAYLVNYFGSDLLRLDLQDFDQVAQLPLSTTRHGTWGSDVAITPDQRTLVVTTGGDGPGDPEENEQLSIVDVADGHFSLVHEVPLCGHVGRFMMGLSHDGAYAYVLCLPHQGGSPILCKVSLSPPFDATRIVLPGKSRQPGDFVTLCVASRLGRLFLCDTEGNCIQVVDIERNETIASFPLEGYSPHSAVLHPHEALLAVACPDEKEVLLISALDGQLVAHIDKLPTGGQLVFSPDGRRLYVGLQRPKRSVAVLDLEPVLAQPGIVFASDRAGAGYQIYRANMNGSHVTPLTSGKGMSASPRWAPEGRRIGFLSRGGGRPCHICVMTMQNQQIQILDQTDPVTITHLTGVTWDWSPDGRTIAFINRDHTAIRRVDVDTGEVRTLIDRPVDERFNFHCAMTWVAQDTIVFSSAPLDEYLTQELFMLSVPTGEVRRLTSETEQGRNLLAPSAAPSGREFVALRQSGLEAPEDFLFLLDGEFRQTAQIPIPNGPPLPATSWSSDGRHVLYAAGPEGAADIYRLDVESRTAAPLITSEGHDIDPDVFGAFENSKR